MKRTRLPRFRLRTILLLVNLFVLMVPIGSIYAFRLYENELVRQTESELIVQGTYITAIYKQAIAPLLLAKKDYGLPVLVSPPRRDEKYTAIEPQLDLSRATALPARPDALASSVKPDAAAFQAAKAISPIIEEATLTTLAGVRITDFHGIVVAGSDEKGLSLAPVEEVANALKGAYTPVIRQRISQHPAPPLASLSRGSNIRIFVAMPIIAGNRVLGAVYLSRSPRNLMKALFDNLQEVEIATGFILIITVALALLTSYAISRPIHALIVQTQRISRGEKDIRPIEKAVTEEIALLSEHIAQMAATIAERSDYIRHFALHVSHEFKTPLTAIQGAIELIEEHGGTMSPEQLGKFLRNTTKDTERLGQLVTRLLEMARADVLQPRDESCDLAAVLRELSQLYRDKDLSIVFNLPESLPLPLPSDIVQTVFTNLFDNSRQHGATRVTVEASQMTDAIHINVTDNGDGISSANAEKLFTPFFTTNRDKGGTGLGLVIIRSLLNAYGATISVMPKEHGAGFILSIPGQGATEKLIPIRARIGIGIAAESRDSALRS